MQLTQQQLEAHLWGAANILRGKTAGQDYKNYIMLSVYKRRRHSALNNPTVMISVDRRDLKTQLSDDFDACDYPNVEKAMGVDDLKRRLRTDWRGTCVTTIQSFQRTDDLEPRQRDTIISLVDECHRTQKGEGKESYAMTMRMKLSQAFRFGFTGTPIDRTMLNTHRDFGPMKEGIQERYLSYYSIKRAIKDRATLEVHCIRDRVPFQVDEEAMSLGFEEMCTEMGLEDEEAKDLGAEHDSCKILAPRLLRTPGSAQNPQYPSQTWPLGPMHGPVTRSVMDRILQNKSTPCGRSARMLRFSCSDPITPRTNRSSSTSR